MAGKTNKDTPVNKEEREEMAEVLEQGAKGTTPTKNAGKSTLLEEIRSLVEAIKAGHLDVRADLKSASGVEKECLQGINQMLDAVINPLDVAADYVEQISRGNIPQPITDNYNGDFNAIKNNLNTCIEAINLLIADANLLAKAAVEGRLATRADATRHQGDFRAIVEGVNNTLDAVIGPMEELSAVMREMEKGNLGVNVQGDYKGDFKLIKETLNGTIAALKNYVNEISRVLTQMAQNNLDVEIRQDFRGDFSAIKDSLNFIITSLNDTMSDINVASDQVADGSTQVARSSQLLAQGAAEQSSAI